MDLNQLKTFKTVAEEKHLTRAAERLYTSQPAISAQLKALEEQLGLALFERTPKGMELTLAGERLLEQAQQTLKAADELLNHAKSLQGEIVAQLSIGTNSELDFLRIPNALSLSQARYPMLELSFTNSMSPTILSDVRKGRLDSGFFFGENNLGGLSTFKLADIPTRVVVPSAWENRIDNDQPQLLGELPWVYTTPTCPFFTLKEEFFKSIGVRLKKKAVFVDTEESIKAMIKAGAGASLLRADDAERAEAHGWGIIWDAPTPSISLSIAALPNRLEEPAIKAWLDCIHSAWQTAGHTKLEQAM